jgi:hypothetical protein
MAPQVEGVKNSKKQTAKHYKAGSQTLKKIPFILLCSHSSSKMICRTEGDAPLAL